MGETPLSRSAELDFGRASSSSRCSTNLLHPVAQCLSCKTLQKHFQNILFCQKRSLEHSLLVFFRGCNCSKRGFWLKLVFVGALKLETPLSRSAELDFGFPIVATPAGMHICYLELKLSTIAASLVAQYLSCKTLRGILESLSFRRSSV